jgi:signal transduction histidine kinase
VSVLLAKTFHSSTLKLALIWIAIFGVLVIALFAYVYWATDSFVRGRTNLAIAKEFALLQTVHAGEGRDGLIAAIARRIAEQPFEGRAYLFADASFAPLAGNLGFWPLTLRGPNGWDDVRSREWNLNAPDQPLLRVSFDTLPDGSHLLVGREVGGLDAFVGKIRTALALSMLMVLILAATASVAVTRRTVGRIESINQTSRTIMQSGLGTRIPLWGTKDEWDQLAENLNLMLDRIQQLMLEVKEVTDNVAHDLRTPLARMRGRLEKAYSRTRDGNEDQSLIGETMVDLDAVLRMFTSLTRISQIETKGRTAAFRAVNLVEIATEVVELFDAAAEETGGQIKVMGDQQVLVTGDRDLLFDALANIVDNAIKHGRNGGKVTVEVAEADGAAVISVADDGPGVPADEFHNVLRRFYRLERSRCTPGNGLGLSLVEAVARLHLARIEMVDNMPGLRFRLRFPSAARA